jgi:ATP-binding protein involved in chromosome partitioning
VRERTIFDVTAVVAIASGKGGVGKSTVSLNLALALVKSGRRVGVLDADIYGPDIPLMLDLKQTRPLKRWLLGRATNKSLALEPVDRYGLKVMSVGFLITEEQSMVLPAQLVRAALRQLFHDVAWGELDFLIVDLPPGTADLQQELVRMVPEIMVIVVVGPQDVAHLDARKLLDMLRSVNVRVLGGVENMAGFGCPHCGERIDVFPSAAEERSLWRSGIERLASIPLDPAFAQTPPVVVADPSGSQAAHYDALAARVGALVSAEDPHGEDRLIGHGG